MRTINLDFCFATDTQLCVILFSYMLRITFSISPGGLLTILTENTARNIINLICVRTYTVSTKHLLCGNFFLFLQIA